MVIWLNGAFGVGKSSAARELIGLLPDARLTDPERIGFVMRRTFWRNIDYQDVPLWRRLVRRQVARTAGRGSVVVPMTVVDRDVYAELTGGARVFLLTASRHTLEHRISGSREAHEWRTRNLERCVTAFGSGGFGEPVATDGLNSVDIARQILERL